MNITEIILLIAAISAAIAAYVYYRRAQKYLTKCNEWGTELQDAKIKLGQYEMATFDYCPYYGIQKISVANYDKLAVVRSSHHLGVTKVQAVIKVFNDDDDEYNQRCAEELLEKLIEK